jgi:hypothetical protein
MDLQLRADCLDGIKGYHPEVIQYLALSAFGNLDNKGKDGKQTAVGKATLRAILGVKQSPATEAARHVFKGRCYGPDYIFNSPKTKSRRGILGPLRAGLAWLAAKLETGPTETGKHRASKKKTPSELVRRRLSDLGLDKERLQGIRAELHSIEEDLNSLAKGRTPKSDIDLANKQRCIRAIWGYVVFQRSELVQFLALRAHGGDLNDLVDEDTLRSILGVEKNSHEQEQVQHQQIQERLS